MTHFPHSVFTVDETVIIDYYVDGRAIIRGRLPPMLTYMRACVRDVHRSTQYSQMGLAAVDRLLQAKKMPFLVRL